MTDDGLPQLDSLSDLQSLFASNFASVIAHADQLKARSTDPEEAKSLNLIKTRLIKTYISKAYTKLPLPH